MDTAVIERSLNELYHALQQQLGECVQLFGRGGPYASRKTAAQDLHTACHDLQRLLTEKDQPEWLKQLSSAADVFARYSSQDEEQSVRFFRPLLAHYNSACPINFDNSGKHDFDKLYERLRNERGIPELFDRMVVALTSMIQSHEIESITVLDALHKVLALLKANRNGSYLATAKSIGFAIYLKHLIRKSIQKLPLIVIFWTAYESAAEEVEGQFKEAEVRLGRESIALIIDARVQAKLKWVSAQPPLLSGPLSNDEPIETELVDPVSDPHRQTGIQ
jgi:hypothetical protein